MSNAKYLIFQAKLMLFTFFNICFKYLEQMKSTFVAFFNKSSNVYASHNSLSIDNDLILFSFLVDADRAGLHFEFCQLWLKM